MGKLSDKGQKKKPAAIGFRRALEDSGNKSCDGDSVAVKNYAL